VLKNKNTSVTTASRKPLFHETLMEQQPKKDIKTSKLYHQKGPKIGPFWYQELL
jgi:hypothetical protein